MEQWLTILLALGMTIRLTRLVALDDITQRLRKPLRGWLLKLVTCGWCASMWIGTAVAVSWWQWSHCVWWQIAAIALTGSWLSGALFMTGVARVHEINMTPVGVLPIISLDDPPAPQNDEPTKGD